MSEDFGRALQLIASSEKVLVVTRKLPSADSIGSILAIGIMLEKMGKEVTLVCHGPLLQTLSFLPRHDRIQTSLEGGKSLVISLDVSKTKVSEFSYDFDENGKRLNIYITPESGTYDAKEISTRRGGNAYDVIITLDCPDLAFLGPVYHDAAGVFYNTPIIAIDHNKNNARYGEVNIVLPQCASTAEVIYRLLEQAGSKYMDTNVATCLLAGIIAGTQSFQSPETTPGSFAVAAKLVEAGGDQQKIIRSIFKSKSLATLKLWGRVLAEVKHDAKLRAAWSVVSEEDFVGAEASPANIEGLVDELMLTVAGVDVVFVLFETNRTTQGIMKGARGYDLSSFASAFGLPVLGGNIVRLTLPGDLSMVESKILARLRELAQ